MGNATAILTLLLHLRDLFCQVQTELSQMTPIFKGNGIDSITTQKDTKPRSGSDKEQAYRMPL